MNRSIPVKLSLILKLSLLAGVTYAACSGAPKLIPPNLIEAGWLDVVVAKFQGYSNPLRAAILKELDEAGEALYGAEEWQKGNYAGYMTYRSPSFGNIQGTNIVYTEKPCDTKAIESVTSADPLEPDGGGAAGSDNIGMDYYQPGFQDYLNSYIAVNGCTIVASGEPTCTVIYIPAA